MKIKQSTVDLRTVTDCNVPIINQRSGYETGMYVKATVKTEEVNGKLIQHLMLVMPEKTMKATGFNIGRKLIANRSESKAPNVFEIVLDELYGFKVSDYRTKTPHGRVTFRIELEEGVPSLPEIPNQILLRNILIEEGLLKIALPQPQFNLIENDKLNTELPESSNN
jgi:hypothetical protein